MIGEFILKQRKKLGLSQEQVASLLKISRPTYVQIERGERTLTVPEAQKLSEVFNISLEDLLKERELPKAKIEISRSSSKEPKEEIRISVPQKKVEKFHQILLYILKKVGGKPNVGMTAIYKFLYFIDFDYYEKYEEQLMGLDYIKNHFGPTPLLFESIIKKMIEKGEVEPVKSKFYQYPQTKYFINPEVEPDLTVLDGKEKEHIDFELQRLSDMTASQLSELSHKDVPWISAESGKSIDYESVFYRTQDTSLRDYGAED